MDREKVTVCIPVYNHEEFVSDAIKSVIEQSYPNIELIIIDDGSTDRSKIKIEALINDCKERFENFVFLSRPNRGLSATINQALSNSSGKYFSILASDDVISKDKIQYQVDLFESAYQAKLGAVCGEVSIITSNDNSAISSYFDSDNRKVERYKFDDVYLCNARILAPSVLMLRKAVEDVGGYKEDLAVEDLYMWLSMTSLGYEILYTDKVVAGYRHHENNTVKNVKLIYDARMEICGLFAHPCAREAKEIRSDISFQTALYHNKKFAIYLLLTNKVKFFKLRNMFSFVKLFIPNFIVGHVVSRRKSGDN